MKNGIRYCRPSSKTVAVMLRCRLQPRPERNFRLRGIISEKSRMSKVPLSVAIITKDEEEDLPGCLRAFHSLPKSSLSIAGARIGRKRSPGSLGPGGSSSPGKVTGRRKIALSRSARTSGSWYWMPTNAFPRKRRTKIAGLICRQYNGRRVIYFDEKICSMINGSGLRTGGRMKL